MTYCRSLCAVYVDESAWIAAQGARPRAGSSDHRSVTTTPIKYDQAVLAGHKLRARCTGGQARAIRLLLEALAMRVDLVRAGASATGRPAGSVMERHPRESIRHAAQSATRSKHRASGTTPAASRATW